MNAPVKSITIIQPDDWHVHLRSSIVMKEVLQHTADRFKRALVMPNLLPPITNVTMAIQYRNEILELLPPDCGFEPLMTLYLTPQTKIEDVKEAGKNQHVVGMKLYPTGATTNSQSGVSNLRELYPVFEEMERQGLVLEIHAESTGQEIDVFDKEADFITNALSSLRRDIRSLKIVLEHATTTQAIDFVRNHSNIAATITPHHLLLNRNDLFKGGLRPHHYCLPILKREEHRKSLVEAAISGDPKFFAGTDSAPHTKHAKESACGCAGVYSAHAAIELYAEVFEDNQSLDQLEAFTSKNGALFYDKDLNTTKITLEKKSWTVPKHYQLENEPLVPFRSEQEIHWKIKK